MMTTTYNKIHNLLILIIYEKKIFVIDNYLTVSPAKSNSCVIVTLAGFFDKVLLLFGAV